MPTQNRPAARRATPRPSPVRGSILRGCLALAAALVAGACGAQGRPAWRDPAAYGAPGPFRPTMESLAGYRCPDWFRDAKLGIWAHWGPQAVPMDGDWYARGMYEPGSGHYAYHLSHYGHPSEFGYKDIIPLWRAEKWDPDRLMALYKRAGARYFVSMACHHDNFDLWNSRFHPTYNSVNMGPKRDVVADWQRAAKKQGLRFGVSEHMGASFTWFQASHGADPAGPKAGVPYDGADPRYAELYHEPAAPGDSGWYSVNASWQREWFSRVTDLIDSYHPDLLYTDGGVPFANEVGRAMIAHYYNQDPARRGLRPSVVYNCKQQSQGRWVEDLERGVMAAVNPHPWQTDTSIGDWYYNARWQFRKIDWVIQMLVDIVSKNGNLLLNVVQRPDGSLDPEAEQLLEQMAGWMAVNGEGIYGTRPWVTYGEGRIRARGGSFGEDFAFSADDIRFTMKGAALYAFVLGRPADGRVTIRALATTAGRGTVTDVRVLGAPNRPTWTRDAAGLHVTLAGPAPSGVAFALRITGRRLRDFAPPAPAVPVINPGPDGVLDLAVDRADLHGSLHTEQQGGRPNLGFWDSPSDYVSWKVRVPAPGEYAISFLAATIFERSEALLEAGAWRGAAAIPGGGSWAQYSPVQAGRVRFDRAGVHTVTIRPRSEQSWKAINLAEVKLTPVR